MTTVSSASTFERGSAWRQWDLHLHTPCSVVQGFGGNTDEAWDRYLQELAELPDGYVVGINDYLFVDGLRKVQAARSDGRLGNLAAVFPVLEFRLSKLAGSKLDKVNLHVIFDPEVTADEIEVHFLHALQEEVSLSSEVAWRGNVTRAKIEELGRKVKATNAPSVAHQYDESDLKTGFDAFTVSESNVRSTLDGTNLKGRYLLALGKTEWAAIPWSGGSVGVKKTILNGVDMVFSASPTAEKISDSSSVNLENGLPHQVLHCSDAHNFADSEGEMKIGDSQCWINADPTFEGLRHALVEYESRVFTGPEPALVRRTREHPFSFVERIAIRQTENADPDRLFFDTEIPFSPGFIAVIGNKGQGKSALLDILSVTAGVDDESNFGFLNKHRFRHPRKGFAEDYCAEISYVSGLKCSIETLSGEITDVPERVTYLPQSRIDEICSADPDEVDRGVFQRELEKVVLAHIPEADRLGCDSLTELVDKRASSFRERIERLRGDLAVLNSEIIALQKQLRPRVRQELENELLLLKENLEAHQQNKPSTVVPPEDDSGAIAEIEQELREQQVIADGLRSQRDELESRDMGLARDIDDATQLKARLLALTRQVDDFVNTNSGTAERLGLEISSLVSLSTDISGLDEAISTRGAERAQIQSQLSDQGADSLASRLEDSHEKTTSLNRRLEVPARDYANYQRELADWQAVTSRIRKGDDASRGIEQVEAALGQLALAPVTLEEKRRQRAVISAEIHQVMRRELDLYRELHRPATEFIDRSELAVTARLAFGVRLRIDRLSDRFFEIFRRDRSGPFLGVDEGEKKLLSLAAEYDFDQEEGVMKFLEKTEQLTRQDKDGSAVDPEDYIRQSHDLSDLYNLLFGLQFLEPTYSLRQGGVELNQLSPGEKGTLLLLFYLLLDPENRPLLLDQPDENLDNRTVKDVLVPALKEAAQRRQVIVVTHNANVAVVADADQVIVAEREDDAFNYSTGSIENRSINRKIVDVLEGSWPAYDNRKAKYIPLDLHI